MLQLLEHIFLTLALTCDVGDRPYGHAGVPAALAERTDAHAQPSPTLAGGSGNPHLLLQPPALPCGLDQTVNRLRHVGVADKYPFDRPDIIDAARPGQFEVSDVCIEHAARMIGDQDAVEGPIDPGLEQGICLVPAA